jgi:hypothetical protein
MFEQARHHLIQVIKYFDDLDFLFLILLVLFVRAVAAGLPLHWRQRVSLIAWSLALAYFLFQYFHAGVAEPNELLASAARATVLFALAQGVLTFPTSIAKLATETFKRRIKQLRSWRRARRWEAEERQRETLLAAKAAAEPIEPSRRERRRRAVAEAEDDYQQELELIRKSALKPYERHAIREDAKRRYLKKLRQMMDS